MSDSADREEDARDDADERDAEEASRAPARTRDDPTRHSRAIAPTSMSDSAGGDDDRGQGGRSAGRASRPGRRDEHERDERARRRREVSWVCAPAASATGVRDALLLTGIPEKSPVARFAAPSAISSRSWLDLLAAPQRRSVRDRTLVSVAATSAIPSAAGDQRRGCRATSSGGQPQRREPDRERPDDRRSRSRRQSRTPTRPSRRRPR